MESGSICATSNRRFCAFNRHLLDNRVSARSSTNAIVLSDGCWEGLTFQVSNCAAMNFDNLNPANSFWTKRYNVWAAPEKEKDRYLQFERWWGAFIRIRSEELDYMVDNLFVGNKLSTAQVVTRNGIRLDMRNIKSPILCF